MTQRIFDIENERDYADLWDIVPDEIDAIEKHFDTKFNRYCIGDEVICDSDLIKIDWHDKKYITRPLQEASESDIGKLCKFWNDEESYIGKLVSISRHKIGCTIYYRMNSPAYEDLDFLHCRRLTKQEIEELC